MSLEPPVELNMSEGRSEIGSTPPPDDVTTATSLIARHHSSVNVTSSSSAAVGASPGGTAVGTGGGGAGSAGGVKRTLSLLELHGLFACSFSYAFIFNTVNNIVIPKEIERLTVTRQSVWVGLIMAAGAISQLSTPVVGAWSDRAGQRTSFLIYGTFITILGIVLFLLVGTLSDIVMLFLAHIVTTIGLSVQYSMVTALLNDYVCDEQVGRGSGAMAILAMLGSGAGYAMFAANVPIHYSYASYILASVLCLGICVAFIPSASAVPNGSDLHMLVGNGLQVTPGTPMVDSKGALSGGGVVVVGGSGASSFATGAVAGGGASNAAVCTSTGKKKHGYSGNAAHSASFKCGLCLDNTINALSMPSPTRYPDFFFACLGRGLFNAGLAGQVYLVYYLRDVMGADNPVQVTSWVSVMALLGGVAGALPSGIISDRVGKKPVIYGSIIICISTLIAFMLATRVAMLQVVGFVYGVGNVAYLSVDYALGVHSLPRKHGDHRGDRGVPIDPAKDLGVFAMSATGGQLFGQVLYGALLDQYASGSTVGPQYSRTGFVAIYTAGGVCFLASAIATSFIRGVK